MNERRIHIIRHGKTEANLKKLYCGATDLPLSEKGRWELEEGKRGTPYPEGRFFYASTLQRTAETLGIIYGDVEVTRLEALSEFNFGAFEMKNYEELKSDSRYIEWISDGTETVSCPGGESFKMFKARISQGFARVTEQTPGDISDIVLVTHGGVIACLMEKHFGANKHFYEWLPKCGCGYTLTLEGGAVVAYKPIP